MKTTKKDIQAVLRTLDRTAIFRMYKNIYGEISRNGIYDFIHEYAPNNRIYKKAYELAYGGLGSRNHSTHGTFEPLPLQRVVEVLVSNCKNADSPYSKMPMMGHTHLYFCHRAWGHSDYNKWCALPINGNERFCEAVIKYAQRYF